MSRIRRRKKKNFHYKIRYLVVSCFLLFLLFLAYLLIKPTYGSYSSKANLKLDVDHAFYVFEDDLFQFNIQLDGIVPSDERYVSTFSISNYDTEKQSEVDLSYEIMIKTTTNLPLQYELYRNESYEAEQATNILASPNLIQDEDGAWYNELKVEDEFVFDYQNKHKDVYYLVIYFPKEYATDLVYADAIENIEVTIDSKQILE